MAFGTFDVTNVGASLATLGLDNHDELTVDVSGNVGIGTASPAVDLEVEAPTTNGLARIGQLQFKNSSGDYTAGSDGIHIFPFSDGNMYHDNNDGGFVFRPSGTEAARIDSSQNLLVGTTTAAGTVGSFDGFGALSGGTLFSSATSNRSIFARRSTDGSIIDFRKDGTTVGSIGTTGGEVAIGTGATGLRFLDSGDAILPHNMATNLVRTNAIDIGSSNFKFKDLYLSGGVYLGGTGSANYLDDYEEGTFTLSVGGTATYTTTIGKYVKIGGLVHVVFDFAINTIGTGSQSVISGLPYAAINTTAGSIGYYSGLAASPVYPTFYITIKRDGVEISRSFSRHVVAPDADITGESAEVQAICAAVHTQDIKDAYAAHLAAQAAHLAAQAAEMTPVVEGE